MPIRPLVLLFALSLAAIADRPNVLLVLSDDHSYPHLGAYGDANCRQFKITPNLDAFAATGMRFNRAYTASPQCAPSRTSIFAGRSPIGISATRFSQPAPATVRFFTDQLRESGYWTGIDGRHQHLDGRLRDAAHIQETLVELKMKGASFESRFDHFVGAANTKGKELKKVPGMVEAALDKVPEGKPFFLYFGFNQPHRQWGNDHDGIDPAQLKLPPDWPDLPEVRVDYARFLAEVRDLDTGFGSVLKVLKTRGLAENTIVIFMGDNGEALLRGKGTVTDRGVHVPLVVRWPGKVKAGSASDVLVSGVDLAPTILAAAEAKVAPGMTGTSFLPALLGQPFEGRKMLFAERGWHSGPITRTDGFDLSRTVITQDYHFVYNALPDRSYTPVDMPSKPAWRAVQAAGAAGKLSALQQRVYIDDPRPVFELYDVRKDPFQLNNLASDPAAEATAAELRTELDRWMVREGDYLPLPTHAFGHAKKKSKKSRR